MEYVQIPKPDFNFENLIKKRAADFCLRNLQAGIIASQYNYSREPIEGRMRSAFLEFPINQRVFFINELIIHTYKSKQKCDEEKQYIKTDKASFERGMKKHIVRLEQFDMLLLFLYNSLAECGIIIDDNVYTIEEAIATESKLDTIIETLEYLRMGHTALGEEIQELKDQITNLQNAIPLGKKNFTQRVTGIAVRFAADKSVELIWDKVKPQFSELLFNNLPKLLEEYLNK